MSSNSIESYDPYQHGVVIENYPGYCVTPDGKLWVRLVRRSRLPALLGDVWTEKKQTVGKHGYMQTGLCNGSGGRAKNFFVHCLILAAFRGPCPPGMQACHRDGDPANNHIDNLRWDTPEANWEDRKRHGRSGGIKGEAHKWVKLTTLAIPKIRAARAAGEAYASIAACHGVSDKAIIDIITGRTWAHVP